MNKKIMTLAVMTAVGLPAAANADSANVEIYGTFVPFLESVKTSGATTTAPADSPNQVSTYAGTNIPSRNRITSGTSNIGFRGSKDIDADLKVVWQVESGLQVDGSTVANTIASRNSRVGFSGDWGTAFIGQWDTPYKWATIPAVNPLKAGYAFDYNMTLNNPGFGVAGTTTQQGRADSSSDAAFDRRQGNSIQYWTPKSGGFAGRIAYSVNEGTTVDDGTTPSISPEIWSLMVSYQTGGLSLRYAYEQHDDYFGLKPLGGSGPSNTNGSAQDTGHKLVAVYRVGNTKLVAAYDILNYQTDETTAGTVNEYERDSYYLLAEQAFGKDHVWLAYGSADKGSCTVAGGGSCSTNGLGATQTVLGYLHRFNKKTDFYASYYKLENEESASYAVFPPVVGGGTKPGADTTGVGIGMLYSF